MLYRSGYPRDEHCAGGLRVALRSVDRRGCAPPRGSAPYPAGAPPLRPGKNFPNEGGNLKVSCPSRWSGSICRPSRAYRTLESHFHLIWEVHLPIEEGKGWNDILQSLTEQEERSVIHLAMVYPISGSSCIGNDS